MKTLIQYGTSRFIKHILLFICTIGLPLLINAQQQNHGGLILDDQLYEQFPLIGNQSEKSKNPPERLSLKCFAPYPKSQGKTASCVGWSVGYGAMTILNAIDQNITDRKYITNKLAHSAGFIYNQIKSGESCRSGASLERALQFVKERGTCLEATFSSYDCNRKPDAQAKAEALQYKLPSNARRLFEKGAQSQTKIDGVLNQLSLDNPVIVGFSITPEYNELKGASEWFPEGAHQQLGHAMLVVGYDKEEQSFELMNSFGYSWGIEGFIKVSYANFARYARHAFVLRPGSARKGEHPNLVTVPVKSTATFELQQDSKTQPQVFQKLPTIWSKEKGLYQLKQSPVSISNQLYRFKMDIPAGRHAYLINLDASQNSNLIFYHPDYYQDTVLYYPKDGGLRLSSLGQENLCLLITHQPIHHIETLINQLAFASGEMMEKINSVFETYLIPKKKIDYGEKDMNFNSSSEYQDGIAVPLVLSIDVVLK